MNNFEAFDVRAWVENGFTRHIAENRKKQGTGKKSRTSKILVGVTLLAAVAVTNSIDLPVTNVAQTELVWPQISPNHATSEIARPDLYWPALIKEVSYWDEFEEPELENPPTII